MADGNFKTRLKSELDVFSHERVLCSRLCISHAGNLGRHIIHIENHIRRVRLYLESAITLRTGIRKHNFIQCSTQLAVSHHWIITVMNQVLQLIRIYMRFCTNNGTNDCTKAIQLILCRADSPISVIIQHYQIIGTSTNHINEEAGVDQWYTNRAEVLHLELVDTVVERLISKSLRFKFTGRNQFCFHMTLTNQSDQIF